MSDIAFEIVFIAILLLANGVFAMSELAIVSSRKARLHQLAETGNAKASAALALASAPDRFLSTIQIGITLVGILAGAFGGATIAEKLGVQISRVPMLASYGEAIGLIIVVLAITYFSLILGELVPKRVALNHPERIAMLVAGPMRKLSQAAAPLVSILSVSTSAVLGLLRLKASTDPPITEEEVKVLIDQGTHAGVFEEHEQEIIESVFGLADRSIVTLMTPRRDIVWLDIENDPEKNYAKTVESHYSRFPVCRSSLDDLLGVVKAKDLLSRCVGGERLELSIDLNQPLFIPESTSAMNALKMFKVSRSHLALVVDEYGAIEGLVTTNDILEAIVGDIGPAQRGTARKAIQRQDGSWLVDGALPMEDFKQIFSLDWSSSEGQHTYHTVAGFILFQLGRVPREGDLLEWQGLRLEIVDMDGKRIDKVLASQ